MTVSLLQLFVTFFKIGAFTFGGGWAMISIIEREIVHNRHWIGKEDFLDLLAVSQSLPGILAVNIAVAIGDRLRGRTGTWVCAAGSIMPSFLIILFIAIFLTPETINGNPTLIKIFKGIRPAVVALIIAPVISAAKVAHLNRWTIWVPVVVALSIWSKVPVLSNPILWIGGGIAVGIYIFRRSVSNAEASAGINPRNDSANPQNGKEGRDK